MTRPLVARLLLIGCLLPAPMGGYAHAEETLVWTGRASDGLVSLSYGTLDPAKTPVFFLSCFDAMGIAVLDLRQDLEGAEQGEPVTIALSAGTAAAEMKGEVIRDESTGTILAEASDIAVKPVLDVLRQSGPLTVTIGETSAALSDQGRAEAVETFSKDCEVD